MSRLKGFTSALPMARSNMVFNPLPMPALAESVTPDHIYSESASGWFQSEIGTNNRDRRRKCWRII